MTSKSPPSATLLTHWLNHKNFYPDALLSHPTRLTRLGQKKALHLFHLASTQVPAYADFLKKNHLHPESITTFSDFQNLPPTTKENYFTQYPAAALTWKGSLSATQMISTSSGSTGNAFYWPRTLEHEIDGAFPHEFIFDQIFKTRDKSTLFINGFPLGNWIAGTFTAACLNLYAWKSGKLTVMSPGYILETLLDTIEKMSPHFAQTIIAGHSPFLKEIIDAASTRQIAWRDIHPKFMGTGQAVTESWRTYLLKKTGSQDYYRTFISLYGSADAALMGWETPYTIFLRQTISASGSQKAIFNDERIPSICAFDPRLTFFESLGGELCITKNSGAPLIRYNIHDEGGLTTPQKTAAILGPDFIDQAQIAGVETSWQFPLVYLFGRTKFMTKIYGANIYTEHVQLALDHELLQPHITGRFILDTELGADQNPQLICRVELNPATSPEDQLQTLIETIFTETVSRVSSEYSYVLNQFGNKVKPHIILHPHGDEKYFPTGKLKKNA